MAKKPILTFQVEPEEEDAISRYLDEHGIKKRSPFIREAVFAWMVSDQPQLREQVHEDLEAWRKEFHGVGSNLNQIAWRLNADQPLTTKQIENTLKELKAEFKKLAKNMKALRNDLDL